MSEIITEDRRSKIIKSKWSGYALDTKLWNDNNASVVKVVDLSSLKLNEDELNGILSNRMIETCSSFLTTSPENDCFVLTKCHLSKLKLKDISALENHQHLQFLDLSENKLTDLSALNNLKHLLYLDVSCNKLTTILQFSPPLYLTYVNLSHNNIKTMTDLSEFWSIVRLDLSHNVIEEISGLANLKYLRFLNLSYNLIEIVDNLDNLNIEELNLEYNCIRTFICNNPENGINTLPNIRVVKFGHNRISSLKFFRDAYSLRLIDLKYNKINDLMEISHLKCPLNEVDFRGNSCTKWPKYKDIILYTMPSVMFIDGCEVSISEKVSAATIFEPPIDLSASRGLTKLIILEQLSIPRIDDSVIPYDEAEPILIILCGPTAMKKMNLGLQVADKFPDLVKYCRSHTTRESTLLNSDEKGYYFVEREEFNEKARNGEYLTVEELVGDNYGFHRSEIAALKLENKIGITQMDLRTSIQMKARHSNTKIVLVLTKSEETHQEWIEHKFKVFTWIKDSIENLWALKISRRNSGNTQSVNSDMSFISDIVNDVIGNLDLSFSDHNIRQCTGATGVGMIRDSRMLLPKLTKTRRQIYEDEKHIKFIGIQSSINILHKSLSENSSDLKVILDENMNIIVDDDEAKRKRKLARLLNRRNANATERSDISESSEESLELFYRYKHVDPKNLMNMYVDVILKSRQSYIDYHLNHPGFFSLVVFSDEFDDACDRLYKFVDEISKIEIKAPYITEIDYINRFIVPEKINEIIDKLKF